jgi:hypothetical protein
MDNKREREGKWVGSKKERERKNRRVARREEKRKDG